MDKASFKKKYAEERRINRMIYSISERHLFQLVKKYFKGKLIDIGCGSKPYYESFKPYVDEHIGIDHECTIHDKNKVDLFGSAYEIPVIDNFFDSAICTAVLEHLEEPEQAIRECHRILKPGGIAIYTVPFIWHVHEEPRDFYRFTNYGLKYLFEKVGFEIIEIKPLSGFIVTFLQLHLYLVEDKLNRGIVRKTKIINLYTWMCNTVGLYCNKWDNSKIWTWCYVVTARKKIT